MIFGLFIIFFSLLIIVISKKIKKNIRRLKEKYNIKNGKITYSDLNKAGKSFFSKRYKITGKPDYIVKRNNNYIPVEIKTGQHINPQKNHIIQLACYCHLLEENYGNFVPYGILVYENGNNFRIPFDPKMRYELENNLVNMRKMIKKGKFIRNHNNPNKCKNCSMQIYCKDKF